jgi:hypothetical protein
MPPSLPQSTNLYTTTDYKQQVHTIEIISILEKAATSQNTAPI